MYSRKGKKGRLRTLGRLTHGKIAQLAGVSQATVSKALNGNSDIGEATRRKILKIADENGYFGQKKAARKSAGKHYRPYIAIVVPEIISLNFAKEATMLVKSLSAADIDGRIYISGFGEDEYNRTIDGLLKSEYADGIISFSGIRPQKEVTVPFVCINQFGVDLPYNLVSSNIGGGIRAAIRHLTDLGHERIGFIGETNTFMKEELFISVMKESGLDSGFIYSNECRFEACGHNGILKMLDSQKLFPTALICAYDEIAYGAINELKLYGYSVPDDFSVIGMNDVTFSKVMEPGLTTVVLHSDVMCAEAVKLLCDSIHGEQSAAKHIEVQCDLTVRKSTSIPRKEIII